MVVFNLLFKKAASHDHTSNRRVPGHNRPHRERLALPPGHPAQDRVGSGAGAVGKAPGVPSIKPINNPTKASGCPVLAPKTLTLISIRPSQSFEAYSQVWPEGNSGPNALSLPLRGCFNSPESVRKPLVNLFSFPAAMYFQV